MGTQVWRIPVLAWLTQHAFCVKIGYQKVMKHMRFLVDHIFSHWTWPKLGAHPAFSDKPTKPHLLVSHVPPTNPNPHGSWHPFSIPWTTVPRRTGPAVLWTVGHELPNRPGPPIGDVIPGAGGPWPNPMGSPEPLPQAQHQWGFLWSHMGVAS